MGYGAIAKHEVSQTHADTMTEYLCILTMISISGAANQWYFGLIDLVKVIPVIYQLSEELKVNFNPDVDD